MFGQCTSVHGSPLLYPVMAEKASEVKENTRTKRLKKWKKILKL